MTFVLAAITVAAIDNTPAGTGQLSGTLDPLSYRYSPVLQATLNAFGQGVESFSHGRFESALAALPDDSSAASTAVADYIMLYRARVGMELGRSKDALTIFRAIRNRYPDSPVSRQAALGEARALLKLDDATSALAVIDTARLRDNAELLYLRTQALEDQGKRSEAVQLYLRIYADYVESDQAPLAERRLRVLAPAFAAKTENRGFLLRRGASLIRAGKNQEARTMLSRLDGARATGPEAEKIWLLLADADTNLKRLTEALRYLRRIKDPSLAAQAVYLEAACYRGLKDEDSFLAARDRAIKLYPNSPFTEKLLYSVATYYDVANEPEPASEAYQAIARLFPKGEYIERALWKVALHSFIAKRYGEALSGFWQCTLANASPAAASAPAYWMGRCCERLGDFDKAAYFFARARALANNSYYGQRAQEALSGMKSEAPANPGNPAPIDFEQVKQTLDGIRPDPVSIPQPSGAVTQAIERARQLMAAGLPDMALLELNRSNSSQEDVDKALCYGMSRIYQSKGDLYGAISTLRRAFPDYIDLPSASLPGEIWDLFFPVRHFDIISQTAARKSLDPSLVLALIRQESAFNEAARSKANARGLMQVLPTTGRLLARQAGISRYTVTKLYHPETNIALGTSYLASLLQRYGGRVELALAAYNAGDSRVDRWLQQFGDTDMAEFVERIPFSETRAYVKQVMSNTAHYQARTVLSSGLSFNLGKEPCR